MEQKYLKDSYNLDGNINLNKKYIGNVIDLIRISPLSARVFMLLCAYASRNNTVISDVNSISKLLGNEDIDRIKSALKTLQENSYIDFKTIHLSKDIDITGVIHDRSLYSESNKEKWEVIGNKIVHSYKLEGDFNIFTINEQFAVADENQEEGSNIVLHINGRLFYDSSIPREDIETFTYPEIYQ